VVDAYANNFSAAGFSDEVAAIRAAHLAGDRRAALAAVSDRMVDSIDIVGDKSLVADSINAYRRAGIEVPVIFPLTWGAPGGDGLDTTLQAAVSAPPI
jgi:hypothetical protein